MFPGAVRLQTQPFVQHRWRSSRLFVFCGKNNVSPDLIILIFFRWTQGFLFLHELRKSHHVLRLWKLFKFLLYHVTISFLGSLKVYSFGNSWNIRDNNRQHTMFYFDMKSKLYSTIHALNGYFLTHLKMYTWVCWKQCEVIVYMSERLRQRAGE